MKFRRDARRGSVHVHVDVQLLFDFSGNGSGMFVDQVSITPDTGPATETTAGGISFSDVETTDTHGASFAATGSGTFSLDPVSECGGTGSVAWRVSVANADTQFLARDQTLVLTYAVPITDSHGASALQDVSIAIDGTYDTPTAVSEKVITDAGPNGMIDIPAWALASAGPGSRAVHRGGCFSIAGAWFTAATPWRWPKQCVREAAKVLPVRSAK